MTGSVRGMGVHRMAEVFWVFLRLGCTSFGGPVAHLGYFEEEFVRRREWLTAETLAELIAVAQSLPGPASSQVGFAIGTLRAGVFGGLAAWVGFTAPSAALMIGFAFGHKLFRGMVGVAFLHGLQLVAVAVVATAVLSMQRTLAPDRVRLVFAMIAAAVVLYAPPNISTLLVAVLSGVGGFLFLRKVKPATDETVAEVGSRRSGIFAAATFVMLLVASILLRSKELGLPSLSASFFQAGSMVFGGGHVVLPMLENLVVAKGWVSEDAFVSGYGAAQALPGPLFSFAAYSGAVVQPNAHPLLYGLVALVGIFSPGLLLMTAVLPFWSSLRSQVGVAAVLRGINAGVVGVLAAALCGTLWAKAVHRPVDFLFVLGGFVALTVLRWAPWVVVLACGGICSLLASLS
ncbi:MAG TPA: chromate efflux transporter [Edaphobacter sp.]|jgi:chromate transporter|nr:chromate efflux transporter [Edaphobacter sp.]